MIIVAGTLKIAAARRDAYVACDQAIVAVARETPGCLDFAISADPIDPQRVDIFERWESREALEAFRQGGPSDDQQADILEMQVTEYHVTPTHAGEQA